MDSRATDRTFNFVDLLLGGLAMGWFGRSNKEYDFEMFSDSHLVIIALLFIVSITIYLFKDQLRNEKWRKAEIGIALSLTVMEGTYHLWMIVNGSWKASQSLPLELCNISLYLTILLLFTKNKLIYDILFFAALLGASQSLATPTVTYDFPHFRFFHFFYAHLIIIWVSLYFTWVKGYRPTILSVIRLFVMLNVLMPIIMFINKRVDGNYMYLSHKPDHASLLDYLGPYPWYILSMEGLLITLSIIVWLVFREKTEKRTELTRTQSI